MPSAWVHIASTSGFGGLLNCSSQLLAQRAEEGAAELTPLPGLHRGLFAVAAPKRKLRPAAGGAS